MHESSTLIARLRALAQSPGPTQGDDRPADAWLYEGLPRAQLHEFYAAERDDAATAMGFAVALARIASAAPILWIRTEAGEREGGHVHATGLVELGLGPDRLLLAVVADAAAQLRVAADAARCAGIGTVVVEAWGRRHGLDLTATRRLMLAAEGSGVTILVVHADAAPIPSAAATRWSVAAAPSTALEANAPGLPAFDIELLRRRGGPAGQRWRVEWNRDTNAFAPIAYERAAAPLSGADLPLVADRPPPQRPPAPVRARG